MCEFWSAIILKNGKVLWSRATSSHETLLCDAGLRDASFGDREFVRIEITPKNMFSKKPKWNYLYLGNVRIS